MAELDDAELERRVWGVRPGPQVGARAEPDLSEIHEAYQRPGVTLELLHLEYLEAHPTGYRYTQFCELYRRWCCSSGYLIAASSAGLIAASSGDLIAASSAGLIGGA